MKAEELMLEMEKNKEYLEIAISLLTKEERLCVLEHIKEYVRVKTEKGEYDELRKALVNQIIELLTKVKVNNSLRRLVMMYIGLLKKDNRIKRLLEKVKTDEFGFTQCSEIIKRLMSDE